MKKEFLLFGLAICCVGCTTVQKDVHVANTNVEMQPVMFEPVTKVIGEKTIGRATDSSTFWGLISTESPDEFVDTKASSSKSFTEIESAAIADACEKSGADIILDTKVTTDEYVGFLGFNRETTVNVDGVPAKIVGARELSLEETTALILEQQAKENELALANNENLEYDPYSWVTFKYGKQEGFIENENINTYQIEFGLNIFDRLDIVGSYQKREFEENIVQNLTAELRGRLFEYGKFALYASLGLANCKYEHEEIHSILHYYSGWVYDNYFDSWNYSSYWYTYSEYVTKESESKIKPLYKLSFEYNGDVFYFGTVFTFIPAFTDDWVFDMYGDVADPIGETKTLEVLLGLNVNKNFRIMGSYINFLGHSDSSTYYGGVCVLF